MGLVAFQTKYDQAQWRYLYDVVKDANYDDFFSFTKLEKLTGFDKVLIRQLVKKVNMHLDKKLLVNIRGEGYQIARPNEHEVFAKGKALRSKRSMDYGLHAILNTDDSELSIEERQKKIFRINHIQSSLTAIRKRTQLNITERVQTQAKQEQILIQEKDVLSKINDIMLELANLKKEVLVKK